MPTKRSNGLLKSAPKQNRALLVVLILALVAVGVYVILRAHAGSPAPANYGSSVGSYFYNSTGVKHDAGTYVDCGPVGLQRGSNLANAGGCFGGWENPPVSLGSAPLRVWYGSMPALPENTKVLGDGFDGYKACFGIFQADLAQNTRVRLRVAAANGEVLAESEGDMTEVGSGEHCLAFDALTDPVTKATPKLNYTVDVLSGQVYVQHVYVWAKTHNGVIY